MNFRNVVCVLAAIGGFLLSLAAQAEWKGKGELGVVLARGNTDTTTINAKGEATTEHDPWKHIFGFSALRSTDHDVTTGDRYELHGESDYKLTAKSYVLGSLRYDSDKFSAYSYQTVASVGYGYKFYDSESTKLATEVGGGYRRSQDRITGEIQSNPIARGSLNFSHKLTMTSELYDKFLVEAGSNNTFIQNEAGIKVNMNESLALSLEHTIRHNSVVKEPLKHTDQLLTANVVFSF